MATTFDNKVAILADLWMSYRNDEQFQDFIIYNDLGLPLAYALDSDIIVANEKTNAFIEETFDLLLAGFDKEDTGFNSMNDLFGDEQNVSGREYNRTMKTINITLTKYEAELLSGRDITDTEWDTLCVDLPLSLEDIISSEINYLLDNPE